MRKLLFTFILVVFTSSELRAGLVYQLIDLGTLGGTVSVANGINNQGEVVGYSYNQGSAMARAFRYSEEMSDLGLQSSGIAQAINSASQVTGQTSFQN